MEPDGYFKHRICYHLGIDMEWLNERNSKKMFGMDKIELIKQEELKSLKAKKIMVDFLEGKKQNISRRELQSKKDTEHIARNEIFMKAIKLRNQILPRTVKRESAVRLNRNSSTRNTTYTNPAHKHIQKPIKKRCFKTEKRAAKLPNYEKSIATVADKLQKNIKEIESSFKKKLTVNKSAILIKDKLINSILTHKY